MELEEAGSAHSTRSSGGSAEWRERPWLVLGGGGLKGLAHIGAWEALQEAGITPAGIVGTSIGALIAALASSGMPPIEMWERAFALERTDIVRVNRRAVWVNGIKQVSVFRGEPLREYLAGLLPPGGWDALDIPVLMNAVDLEDGSDAWFGQGERTDVPLVDAVYASSALPVFYPPLQWEGRAFVDGGVTRSLPIGRAEEEGAERIIAIDVGSSGRAEVSKILEGGMIAVHQRVSAIMGWKRRYDLVAAWKGAPLLYVRPDLAGYGTWDFQHVGYFLDEGYRAMRAALTDGDSWSE